jgi:TM2 domain-containing membrane protein YozV
MSGAPPGGPYPPGARPGPAWMPPDAAAAASARGPGWTPPAGSGAPPPDLPPGADWSFKDKKVVAGILGILFGSLGVHKFILGYVTEGVIMAAVTVATWLAFFFSMIVPFFAISSASPGEDPDAGWFVLMVVIWGIAGIAATAVWIVGVIEGITYLTKSDRDFVLRYNVQRRGWF